MPKGRRTRSRLRTRPTWTNAEGCHEYCCWCPSTSYDTKCRFHWRQTARQTDDRSPRQTADGVLHPATHKPQLSSPAPAAAAKRSSRSPTFTHLPCLQLSLHSFSLTLTRTYSLSRWFRPSLYRVSRLQAWYNFPRWEKKNEMRKDSMSGRENYVKGFI